jgi:hypothetical protein
MKTIKTQSYLPVFTGFYNSFFEDYVNHLEEMEYEYLAENGIQDEEPEFDYRQYYIDCSYEMMYKVCELLTDLQMIDNYDFVELQSPKEYNFKNDVIAVDYTLTEQNVTNIKSYISDNYDAFALYIKNNYTSYEGFYSYYSNDAKEWFDCLDECLNHEHKLGSILDFVLDNEGVSEHDIFERIVENGCIYLNPVADKPKTI